MHSNSYVMKSKNYRILSAHSNGTTLKTFKILIEKLNYMSPKEILNVYWLFTYSPSWALQLNNFDSDAPIKFIRKEILHFLKTTEREFWNEINSPIVSNTERKLYELVPESFFIIRYKLKQLCKNSNCNSIDRAVYLLSSDAINMKFGGLRSCNFKVYQCEYLLPFSNQIGKLLNEIYYKNKNSVFSSDRSVIKNSSQENYIKEIDDALLTLKKSINFLKSQGFKNAFFISLLNDEI